MCIRDRDILFKGNDGGAAITALTLDMSAAGSATFNHDVILANDSFVQFGDAGENIAGDGTNMTIASSGKVIIDAAGDVEIDGGSGVIDFIGSGTVYGNVATSSNDFIIKARQADKDLIFKGVDDSSEITAGTFDMSDAGTLVLNHDLRIADSGFIGSASDSDAIGIASNGVVTFSQTPVNSAGAAFVTDDPTALAIALG